MNAWIRICCASWVFAGVCTAVETPSPPKVTESPEARAQRMRWFKEARFGMFIHWGLYAIPAGEWKGKGGHGEWIRETAHIPLEDYHTLLGQFNPQKFDAAAWARTARETGMRYVVITSKHHDGFALWPSDVSDFDVAVTPFKRDILRELADACRKEGIVFCVYHSIMDWNHPDYLPRRKWEKDRSAEGADFERYVDYLKAQLKELVTRYGPLGILWFDGEWESTWTPERGWDLDRYVRGLQSDIIINNRVGKGREGMAGITRKGDFAGDYGTPEQEVPPRGFGPGVYWESCMTIGRAWCDTRNDQYRSATTLIRHLSDIASKGGNYLLNVGPQADGQFPAGIVERLREMGDWMRVNGEAIHGTDASPLARLRPRATCKPGRIFVHLHEWPDDRLVTLTGLMNPVDGARLLANGEKLTVEGRPGSWTVRLPERMPDERVTVVEVSYSGGLNVDNSLRPDESGTLTLKAADAVIEGEKLALENKVPNLGFWANEEDKAHWDFTLDEGGVFNIEVDAACKDDSAGSAYAVTVVDQMVRGEVPATGGWDQYRTLKPGQIAVPHPGSYRLELRARKASGVEAIMNVRAIRLVPASKP